MNWTLARFEFADYATVGALYDEAGTKICYTLEDTVRKKKVYGRTAIPKGKYRLDYTHSGRFGRLLPLLVDVPLFVGIRIHAGNSVENTDGCILPGLERAYAHENGLPSWHVYQSQTALEMICTKVKTSTEPICLSILGGHSPEEMAND